MSSDLNHLYKTKTYVSVSAFADLFGKTYKLANNKKSVTFNGKTIKNIRLVNGKPTAWINDLGAAVQAQKVSWDAKKQEAYVLVLTRRNDSIRSSCSSSYGEHWANPKQMPNGPYLWSI